jgi:hypothetical protein
VSQALVEAQPTLEELAERINRGYVQAMDEKRQAAIRVYSAMDRALEVGGLLRQAKEQVPDGQWYVWLRGHTNITQRTATSWMRLAANRPHVAGLGVRKALELLAEPKTEKPTQVSARQPVTHSDGDTMNTNPGQSVSMVPQDGTPLVDEDTYDALVEAGRQRGWTSSSTGHEVTGCSTRTGTAGN